MRSSRLDRPYDRRTTALPSRTTSNDAPGTFPSYRYIRTSISSIDPCPDVAHAVRVANKARRRVAWAQRSIDICKDVSAIACCQPADIPVERCRHPVRHRSILLALQPGEGYRARLAARTSLSRDEAQPSVVSRCCLSSLTAEKYKPGIRLRSNRR